MDSTKRVAEEPVRLSFSPTVSTGLSCDTGNTERAIVGAHYDGAGRTPGADDNGSDMAGLLDLGRLIRDLNPEPETEFENRINRTAKTRMSARLSLSNDSIVAPPTVSGTDLSNHINFWKSGYSAAPMSDSAFYRNPHSHERTDRVETIGFARMTEIVKGAYWAVVHL